MQQPLPLANALIALLSQPSTLALLLLLLLAAVVDLRSYRIPNVLTVTGMLAGLALNAFGSADPWSGLGHAFAGMAVALLLLLPLHALRALGAGDVKLMAAVGAFLGLPAILPALLFVAVASGAVALCFALFRRIARRSLLNVAGLFYWTAVGGVAGLRARHQALQGSGRIPFAVPIALGTFAFLLVRQPIA
jgi:prepilin peptidase CpaA